MKEKDISQKDLTARLLSGVKYKLTQKGLFNLDDEGICEIEAYGEFKVNYLNINQDTKDLEIGLVTINNDYGVDSCSVDEIIPILFPLSYLSKTSNKEKLYDIFNCDTPYLVNSLNYNIDEFVRVGLELDVDYAIIKFCDENHINYRLKDDQFIEAKNLDYGK